MHPARTRDYRARPLQCHTNHVALTFSVTHIAHGVEPCGLPRTLGTHETGRPSALGQGFEGGLRCGDASAARPPVLEE